MGKNLPKVVKEYVIDINLLADEKDKIEIEKQYLDRKDEKDLDYPNADSYLHAVAITHIPISTRGKKIYLIA